MTSATQEPRTLTRGETYKVGEPINMPDDWLWWQRKEPLIVIDDTPWHLVIVEPEMRDSQGGTHHFCSRVYDCSGHPTTPPRYMASEVVGEWDPLFKVAEKHVGGQAA
jgi:hypothetical protein